MAKKTPNDKPARKKPAEGAPKKDSFKKPTRSTAVRTSPRSASKGDDDSAPRPKRSAGRPKAADREPNERPAHKRTPSRSSSTARPDEYKTPSRTRSSRQVGGDESRDEKPSSPRSPRSGARPPGKEGARRFDKKVGKRTYIEEKETTDHTSGWKSESQLTNTDTRKRGGKPAGFTQYRNVPGKSWKGKPVVEVRHTMRLNRYISNSGICSRREADNLIAQGLIEVNGKQIIEMGYQVKEEDKVTYAGERINPEKPTYVLLNKPKDYITTANETADNKSVMTLLGKVGNVRLAPVGRLDRNTTGLLLLTNDANMAKKLNHPTRGVKKLYHVHLDKTCKAAHMKALLDGIELEDGFVKADTVEYVTDVKDKKQVGIELQSSKNRIVRRLFEHLGYNVIKLDRVVYAGLTKKDLPRGRWRYLSEQELNRLKMV